MVVVGRGCEPALESRRGAVRADAEHGRGGGESGGHTADAAQAMRGHAASTGRSCGDARSDARARSGRSRRRRPARRSSHRSLRPHTIPALDYGGDEGLSCEEAGPRLPVQLPLSYPLRPPRAFALFASTDNSGERPTEQLALSFSHAADRSNRPPHYCQVSDNGYELLSERLR